MTTCHRRSLLAALAAALPLGLGHRRAPAATLAPRLSFRPFDEAVRAAFAAGTNDAPASRRVEVGDSDLVRAGLQGCHNDRPFAGFPAGHLRIVRAGTGPGPVCQGVRLYVHAVEIEAAAGRPGPDSRPLDFAALPPAPFVS